MSYIFPKMYFICYIFSFKWHYLQSLTHITLLWKIKMKIC
jgi:hypothetical protein